MTLHADEELARMGFASVGRNVRVSTKASFYGIQRIEVGNDSRIERNLGTMRNFKLRQPNIVDLLFRRIELPEAG